MDEVSPSNEAVPGAPGSGDSSSVSSWCPRELVFTAYSTPSGAVANKTPNLRVVVRRPLVARLTKDIVETYQICNPQFKYSEEQNPKRYLTSPSVGVLNDGFDNANSDLILTVNSVLANPETQRRYIVKDVLGHGTFGQVAKCWVLASRDFVAVKIIKNQPAYYQQALVEVSILTTLNKNHDPEDKHHIVRIYDYFVYRRHLCICFELLDTNLYELIKINHLRGLSLSIVQLFSKQILRGLALLKEAGIIHCDLKPENILLCTSMRPAEIKIIDFGSACMEDRTVYSYIQSRYYRSPEVLLGYQYTTAIDMWSFGCIVAELFLGLPLFPGASEFDLLQRMIKILGGQPPDYVLKEAKNATKFFKCIGNAYNPENAVATSTSGRSIYQALSGEEYEVRELKKPTIGKEYFNHMNLEAIVKNYPYRKNLPKEDIIKETQIRLALIDFLHGLVEFDPAKRWSPLQASRHPFVTGEPFTCPYQPPPESPRMLVAHQNMRVSHHHPGGGHWFAAGLSPNVAVWNYQVVPPGPSFQGGTVPHGHPSSYGSLGSHGGSYNDSGGLATSYGSHGGDGGVMFAYYSPVCPSAMNNLNTTQGGQGSSAMMLGSSPDRRRRNMQFSHGSGLGVSPSAGNFAPLPLGTSPSQFTPPNSSSYNQFPAGHYGPTSPARGGSIQGSPLGKSVTMNRRMGGWGYSSSPQENSPSQQQQQQQHCRGGGHPTEGSSSQAAEEVVVSHISSSNGSLSHLHSNANAMSWKQQQPAGRNGVVPDAASFNVAAAANSRQSSIRLYQQQQTVNEMAETNIIPDPGDWDPNYSDDLLLQEDGSDTGSTALAAEFVEMHFNSAESMVGVRRPNQVAKTVSSSSSSSINTSSQREGSSSYGDQVVGKYACPPPPPPLDQQQQQQQHSSGHVRGPPPPFKPPPHSLSHHQHQHQYYNNPLSRLGQQRMNHGSSSMSDRNDNKVQHPPHSSSFTSSGIHQSPGSSSLVNGISSWGGRGGRYRAGDGGGFRAGDGLASIRPTVSRGRKDFGRLV